MPQLEQYGCQPPGSWLVVSDKLLGSHSPVIALGSSTPYWSKSPRYLPPKTVSNFLSLEERKKLDLRAIVERVVKDIVICWRIPSVENGILYHVLLQPCPETVNLQRQWY